MDEQKAAVEWLERDYDRTMALNVYDNGDWIGYWVSRPGGTGDGGHGPMVSLKEDNGLYIRYGGRQAGDEWPEGAIY